MAWLWVAEIAPALQASWAAAHDGMLSPSERARLQGLQRAQRRAQFLAGHVLLRRLVAARSGIGASAVEVATLADGRPQVRTPAGWDASISHSRGWVAALACAAGEGAGVDVEWMDPRRDVEAIARAACGAVAESREHAYRIWAQHEAELKAGSGVVAVCAAAWNGLALAVCAAAAPEVEWVDLASRAPPRRLPIEWTMVRRLPDAGAADGA